MEGYESMKFIIITGPQAVGKMTVGQELVKITNLKLLHNHMTIEVLTKIFDYSGNLFRKLNEEFRIKIFKEFAKSNEEGIIFTTTWDFDDKEEWDRINKYIFTKINQHTEVGKSQIMLYIVTQGMIKRFLTSMINVTRSMIIVTHSLENQVTQSMIDI